MKHQDSHIQCLVGHFDKDGNVLPQCIHCSVCHQWIRPQDMNKECAGSAENEKKVVVYVPPMGCEG